MGKGLKMLLLLAFTSLMVLPTPVHAQFWKNWGKDKEEKKPSKKPTPSQNKKPIADTKKPVKKTRDSQLDFPTSTLKTRYRVDILLPLYLNELVEKGSKVKNKNILSKANNGLNLYEGIKLAADTLNLYGYKLDIHVHDIADILHSPETLINTNALDSSDLILGAVNAMQVAPMAKYAKKHKVNFVSILSPYDGEVTDNYFFTLIQPTLQSHCEWIRKDAETRYPNRQFVVFQRTTNNADKECYNFLIPEESKDALLVKANILPPVEQLTALFDSTQLNLIMMPILDPKYAEMLLKYVSENFAGYHFEVYGMPSWKGISALRDGKAIPNMTVMLTSPFYFDVSTPSGQAIFTRYKNTFGGSPSEMVFRGYETMKWYAFLLDKYGHSFNKNYKDITKAPWTQFEVVPRFNKENDLQYNENKHLYMYRFSGGNYTITQ